MLKRAARGHEKDGIEKTVLGSCAVECPACPHPDKNMPDGWRDAPKNKNDALDPDHGNGYAYFVSEKPYKEYLEKYKDEMEPDRMFKLDHNFLIYNGRTDGEAPEQGWAEINPLASSTKEMGPGSQRDALDSHFADYNWRKIIGLDE
ncbi:hypothetical protein C0992_011595 [Termitomyces sp. T32_za158]|nr:hypothetical protein C0992_011595 [Termitomyces sp. T32_za158]